MRACARLGWLAVFCALAGCWGPREATLRYAPAVGSAYQYQYVVNLDKTTSGETTNERIEMLFRVDVLGQQGGLFQTRWTGAAVGGTSVPQDVVISDRYVSTGPGVGNLNFPTEQPVRLGATWTGQDRLQFGDLMAVQPPSVEVEYELTRLRKEGESVIATIQCRPKTTEVSVPMEIGSLGLNLDSEGRVESVRPGSPAEGKVLVGDLLWGMNSDHAETPEERERLAQRLVEPPAAVNVRPILLALRRKGVAVAVSVKPELVRVGSTRVVIDSAEREVVFDTARGIPISDSSKAKLIVTYQPDPKADEYVDDYIGRKEPLKFPGQDEPPREYNYHWTLKLLQ